jgi:ketosteroid isomerase-like protein
MRPECEDLRTMGDRLDHVRSYYEALNTGDADAVARHFTDDAVHWYTRREPHVGARAIAENAALGVEHLNARWKLEHAVEGDGEVAIEWTMAFDHPRDGRRLLDRGAEFLAFRGDLICEVRAYYNERGGDLVGFDHAGRGHTTL